MGKQNELKKKKAITNDATDMEVVKEKYVSVEIEKLKIEIKYWKECYYQKKKDFEDLRCDFDNK